MIMNFKRLSTAVSWLVLLSMLFIIGCGTRPSDNTSLEPTDEQQIETMVEDYFKRDPSLPEYTAEVEAIADHWARVSISPVGVENIGDKVVLYVQDQVNAPEPVPTAALELSRPLHDAEAATKLGWAIITQPQANFTDEELDAAMVPESIRR